MKCVILAGGYGTRLGSITRDKPKPMIAVNNKPVIEHLVDNLHSHGIHEIIIKLHYLPSVISDCIGKRALYYYEDKLLSHKETIMSLKWWLENEDFMVINSDTITNINYTDMIQQYQSSTISVFFDEWRCAGTWIYSKDYFKNQNIPIIPYRPQNIYWFDIGTRKKLQEARQFFK